MRFKGLILILLSFFCSYRAAAQVQGELTQSRILILLDESSSMIQKWEGGKEKYKAADELILHLMDSIYAVNNQVEFSLRVFGHQHTVEEHNCYDTKNEVAFTRDNRTQMAYRLDDIHPLGVTPIAYSLMQAAEYDLVDETHNAYSIILITDGGESCGGDLCEVMARLLKNKVYFKPYIVSLENDPALKVTYACMGNFLQVTREGDIPKAVSTIVEAFRPIIKITPKEYKQMQTIAANAPSILKVNVPIVKMPDPVDSTKLEKPVVVVPKPVVVAPPPPPHAPVKEPVTKLTALAIHKTTRYNIDAPQNLQTLHQVDPGPLPALVIELPPPPPVKPANVNIPPLTLASQKYFNLYTVYNTPNRKIKTVTPPPLPPVIIEKEAPVPPQPPPPPPPVEKITIPAPVKISRATPARVKQYIVDKAPTIRLSAVTPPPLPKVVFEVPPAPKPVAVVEKPAPKPVVVEQPKPKPIEPPAPQKPPVEKISHLKLAHLEHIAIYVVMDEHSLHTYPVPPLPPVKAEPLPVAKAPVTKPGTLPTKEPAGKKMDYVVDSKEDAKETTLEVYFTNGAGKFYTTSPQIVLLDPATKKEVKKFYRTVDPDGNPDPQTNIPVGTYNLTFPAKKNLVISNLHVEPNKHNKVIVKVNNVSLTFAYAGAPNRPVTEFAAQVIERDRPNGRVQNQKCTATLQYEPGNYHIRINTFPEDVRNVDLDLDEEYEMKIPQPGFMRFTSDAKQVVTLYKMDGDRFKAFASLDLNDPSTQHKAIQPGEYQVHYHKGPGGPSTSEKVIKFLIKSTEETEVTLN